MSLAAIALQSETITTLTAPLAAGVLLLAYLLGSIPFGYLIVKLGQGRDIRAAGSGNIGAANVTRTVGAVAGGLTLLLDAAKGFLAVWLASQYGTTPAVLAAVAAVVGHMFPVWLKFQGGKGVATGVGVFLVISWPAVGVALLVWLAVVGVWRYVSLASMVASAAMPALLYLLYAPPYRPPHVVTGGAALIAAMIIVKHRANIGRMIAGTEPRFKLPR